MSDTAELEWYALTRENAGGLAVFWPRLGDVFVYGVCARLDHVHLIALLCSCKALLRYVRGACRSLAMHVDSVVYLRRLLSGRGDVPRPRLRADTGAPALSDVNFVRRCVTANKDAPAMPEVHIVEARLVPSLRPSGLHGELCLFDVDLTTLKIVASVDRDRETSGYARFSLVPTISFTPKLDTDPGTGPGAVGTAHAAAAAGRAHFVEYTGAAVPLTAAMTVTPDVFNPDVAAWDAHDRILLTHLAEARADMDRLREARGLARRIAGPAAPVYAPVVLETPLAHVLAKQRRSMLDYLVEMRKDRGAPDYAEKLRTNAALAVRGTFAVSTRLVHEGRASEETPRSCALLRYLGPTARDAQHSGALTPNAAWLITSH
jgi:hypothetical protein